MESRANIVVIGGGVVGCSVLYHLVCNGETDCILLERDELTSGSSWHAAGGFHTINSDPHMAKLQEYTINLYEKLEEESGQSCGVHLTGGLILTGLPERLDFLKYTHARAQAMGIETELISMRDAKSRIPIMDESKFCGALYESKAGHLDPSGTTHAYAKAAKNRGAKIYKKTIVKELSHNLDGSWDLITNNGTIRADKVVNAGGLWAREVGRMIGVELPLLAMEHHYLLTETIPEIKNNDKEIIHAIDLEGEIYLRQESDGVLLGTYEQNSVPWSEKETPWDFSLELLPPDIDRISSSLEIGFSHFPPLERAGIKRMVNGPFVFTPDGNPLIGPLRGVNNFWLACGVMAGFSQGGGVGWALANWISHGDPGTDTLAIDIARFGNWTNIEYTKAKVQENYQRRFRIVLPNETLPAGRPLLKSPLYSRQKRLGAKFDSAYGLEHPLWFAGENKTPTESPSFRRAEDFFHVSEECFAARNYAALIETTNFGKYHIKNSGAKDWLSSIMAGRIPKKGRLSMCPMLDTKGRIIGDFTLAAIENDEFILFGSGTAEDFHLRYFEENLSEDDNLSVSPMKNIGGLSLVGPLANQIMQQIVDDKNTLNNMKFFDFNNIYIMDIVAFISRVSFTGEFGYEIWVKTDELPKLFDRIYEIGKQVGMRLLGARAFNSLRLEKHFGAWGREYTNRDTALEASLGKFIDPSRKNYIGANAVEEEYKNGIKRKLSAFSFNAKDADAHGDEPIFVGKESDKIISRVTSAGFGHCVGKSIAMAYIPYDFNEFDNLYIDILGERIRLNLDKKPLIDVYRT